MADVLKKNRIEILTATWKAASSAATNVELTNAISLTPGTWLIIGQNPLSSSTSGVVGIQFSDATKASIFPEGGFTNSGTYSKCFAMATVTAAVDAYLRSASNTSVTYTYTDRGGIIAIKVS